MSHCDRADLARAYALQAPPSGEVPTTQAHIASCPDCQREVESLRPVVHRFVSWPTDVLRPTTSLQARLAFRIAEETGKATRAADGAAVVRAGMGTGRARDRMQTARDRHGKDRVSMLVRLAPGASYPAHTHAGVEELHLLDGELWIDERKLFPGDYNYGAPGAGDERVWSETGCTCVLITSTKDVLR